MVFPLIPIDEQFALDEKQTAFLAELTGFADEVEAGKRAYVTAFLEELQMVPQPKKPKQSTSRDKQRRS
jgi:hypothetical protein